MAQNSDTDNQKRLSLRSEGFHWLMQKDVKHFESHLNEQWRSVVVQNICTTMNDARRQAL